MSPSEYQALVEFLTERFIQVDGQFATIDRRFHDLTLEMDRRFTVVDGRLAAFQVEVNEKLRDVVGHFDTIYGWLERLEQEYHVITQQLRRIEAALTDETGRRDILERDLAILKEQIALLQSRIADIERRLNS